MRTSRIKTTVWALLLTVAVGTTADGSLLTSYTFQGHGNWSIDAVGGNDTPVGTIEAFVPVGSTVQKAFLYSTTWGDSVTPSVTFAGQNYSGGLWTALGLLGNGLQAFRAEVTNQVALAVGGGNANRFSFQIDSESPNGQVDGEGLVVVYSNALDLFRSIILLDGSSSPAGDTATVNLAAPLDLTQAGFEAQLSLGIGFGFQGDGQYSNVDIDGRRLTSAAGGQDDGIGENGALITFGGLDDSLSNPLDPDAIANNDPRFDDELYNLALGNDANANPFLTQGSTSFTIRTSNPSNDDNIFFTGLNITAIASIGPPPNVPEPSSLAIAASGALFGCVTFFRRRSRKNN